MVRLPASRARDSLAEILNRVAYAGDRVILQRHGKDVAAVVSLEDLERLEAFEDARDLAAAEAALASGEPTVAWEQLKHELPY